jgi:hypothetical protein
MAIYSQSQLVSASNATYTTNGSGSITGATVRSLNLNWISSSILAPMTSSMTVLSASYAGTASVLLGSVVSASYALSSSYALNATTANSATTASYWSGSTQYAVTAGTAATASYVVTAQTASYVLNAVSASRAVTSANGFPYVGKGEVTGSVNISGSAYGNVVAVSVSSNTASIDLASGNFFTVTLANSATTFFNVTNPLPGVSANLILTTGTVSSASFSSNVKQPSGSAYLPTSGSGQIDALSLIAVDSSNVYLVASKKFV